MIPGQEKKNRKYRLVNYAVELNRVIIKNANLLPAVNSFSKEFAGFAVISLINFFFGYD